MPELQVGVVLPYYLRLAEGDYQTAQVGEVVEVVGPLLLEGTPPRTPLRARFNPEDSADPEEIQKRRARCGEQLLRRINRLLRWYRSASRRADVTELTRAQVSPFQFQAIGAAASGGVDCASRIRGGGAAARRAYFGADDSGCPRWTRRRH